jgi:hypothetical protein
MRQSQQRFYGYTPELRVLGRWVWERSRAALGVAFCKTLLAAFDKFWQSDACQTL